ncbi:hypothetical protein SB861_25255 [Paraburkholderia sp. SIMBA_049]
MGKTELQIPARAASRRALAQLQVRCTPLTLRASANRQREKLALAEVFSIHVLEVEVNDSVDPLEWLLGCSMPCRAHRATKPPDTVPSLEQIVLRIASLGGYLNRKRNPPPGPTVMWRGDLALYEISEMCRIFRTNE